jgi:signal transduction histidine kinase
VRGLELLMRDRKGAAHHLLVSAEVIELDGVRCLLSVSDDITDRKLLEEQLMQSQKLESVGRLAGGIAHDFNNLLTVINGYSGLILQHPEKTDLLPKRMAQIRQAGERAAELTQQLLAFSRKQVIQPKPLNLNTLVYEMEAMLRRLLPENIEMVLRLDPALGEVLADHGQIYQVLMNLGANARDAMPHGGNLIVETANVDLSAQYAATHTEVKPGPFVLLGVTDTGVGMDEEVLKNIFEPFFTTKGIGAGTGLGLATVYGIVRQSGGWISAYSEPAKGTSFKIYLPRITASSPGKAPERAPAGTLRGSETVLLVEDQPDVRNLAREVLESFGYRVLEAINGAAALELAGQYKGRIHLLLTDVVMPVMNGTELARRLATLRPETKVLYTSGYTENVIVHQGILKPGIAFVPKPLSPDVLVEKVRETLGPSD